MVVYTLSARLIPLIIFLWQYMAMKCQLVAGNIENRKIIHLYLDKSVVYDHFYQDINVSLCHI